MHTRVRLPPCISSLAQPVSRSGSPHGITIDNYFPFTCEDMDAYSHGSAHDQGPDVNYYVIHKDCIFGLLTTEPTKRWKFFSLEFHASVEAIDKKSQSGKRKSPCLYTKCLKHSHECDRTSWSYENTVSKRKEGSARPARVINFSTAPTAPSIMEYISDQQTRPRF